MVGIVDLGDDPSVPKLMEFLRSAFRRHHFDDVEEILMAREKKWQAETEKVKSEIEGLRIDKLTVEDELKNLKELIGYVYLERKASKEKERKLLEERKEQVSELRAKMAELEKEKGEAEALAALWKSRYEELELRVSRLERDAPVLLGLEPENLKNNGVEGCSSADGEGTVAQNVILDLARVKIEADVLDETTCPVEAPRCRSPAAENGCGGRVGRHIIDIIDSDDECNLAGVSSERAPGTMHSSQIGMQNGNIALKRKIKLENNCADDNTQISKSKIMRQEFGWTEEQMTAGRPSQSQRSEFVMDMVHFNGDDSDSSSDSDSDQSDNDFISDVKTSRKWKTEIDMLYDFKQDPELCLDAVCALYRQEIAPKGLLSSSKDRGFNKIDAPRGPTLAKFLIDGDPQGKRRKSVEELLKHDKEGVDYCMKLAASLIYRTQLFEIYKNQKDPLFP